MRTAAKLSTAAARTLLAALLALLLVLLLFLLAACGTARDLAGAVKPDVADRLEDRAGVRAAALRQRALDTDYYSHDLVADMEADASPEQMAAVLDEMTAWSKTRNDERTMSLYLGAGTTGYDAGWPEEGPSLLRPVAAPADNLANARLFLAATAAFDERVVVAEPEAGAGWRIHSDDIFGTARRVLADPVMAAAPGLVIEASRSLFASSRPLTAEFLAAYERALSTLPQPSGATASVMTFGSPRSGEDFGRAGDDRLEIILVIQTRERRPLAAIGTDPAGNPFWPAVRSQLDVLKGAPDGSGLMVWLQYDPIGAEDFRKHHDLVALTTGKAPLRIKEPSWNDEAAAYLAR